MKLTKHIIPILIALLIGQVGVQAQQLSLDSCLNRAIQANATIENARLDIESAKLVKKEALTNYFPKITGAAFGYYALNPLIEFTIDDIDNALARDWLHNLYYQVGSPMGLPNMLSMCENGITVGASAMQPVFMGGQIVNGNKLAKVGVEAARLQSDLTQQQVLQQTEQAYWLVVSLHEKQQTVQKALQLIDTLYRDAQGAVDAGLMLSNDLLKVVMKRNELLSSKLQLDNGVLLATRALCQLIAVPYSDTLKLTDTLSTTTPVPATYRKDLSVALQQRREVELLDLNLRAEKLKKKMTIGQTLPHLTVGVGGAYGNLIFDVYKFNAVGFALLEIPLTDWWSTGYKIKGHNIAIQKAENQKKDLTEKMSLEMQQAWNNLEEAYQQVLLAESSVDYAKQNVRTTQANYEAGIETVSNLLEAQTLCRQAIDQLTDSRIDYKMKVVRYQMLTNP